MSMTKNNIYFILLLNFFDCFAVFFVISKNKKTIEKEQISIFTEMLRSIIKRAFLYFTSLNILNKKYI